MCIGWLSWLHAFAPSLPVPLSVSVCSLMRMSMSWCISMPHWFSGLLENCQPCVELITFFFLLFFLSPTLSISLFLSPSVSFTLILTLFPLFLPSLHSSLQSEVGSVSEPQAVQRDDSPMDVDQPSPLEQDPAPLG